MRIITLVLALVALTTFSGCATMRRHPAVTGLVAGAIVGGAIVVVTHPHCHHYEPGNNGVNVNCPHYDGK